MTSYAMNVMRCIDWAVDTQMTTNHLFAKLAKAVSVQSVAQT